MKITIELETDEEKAQAVRFLGSDETPKTFTAPDRVGFRLLLALRQLVSREDRLAKRQVKK